MPATTAVKATPVPRTPKAPKDPEAAALADAATVLARAAGLKSAYTPMEARGVVDHLTVERKGSVIVVVKDGGEPVRVKLAVLRAFLAGEVKDDDTKAARAVLSALSAGLPGTMYPKKTAAFILASAA